MAQTKVRDRRKAATADDAPSTGRRRALVTGASSGIGEEFARQLAKKGYDLVLVARRKDRLDKLAAELSQAHSIAAEVLEADLSGTEGVSSVETRLAAGDIDLLVNNAGFGTRGEFAALSVWRELEEIDVNIKALMVLTHAALQSMIQRRQGIIINVASMAGFQPVPFMSTYAASKAFVLHFSEGLHEEVKRQGVTVTCLCPGGVGTEFQQVAGLERRRMPKIGWQTTDKVVAAALRAAFVGRAIVVPGAVNRAGVATVKFAPRFLARRIAGSMFEDAGGSVGDRP